MRPPLLVSWAMVGRFGKRDDLVVHQEEPFNAETSVESLLDPVTDTDAFYVRGHGPVPDIDPALWRLRVNGMVERELSLSLATMREAFRERTVVATLQCAGNRRAGLMAIRDIPGEAPWGPGATGTAIWSGAALRDVLALAGPIEGASDVGFEGADASPEAVKRHRKMSVDRHRKMLVGWGR
jgi:sulfite oxidase